MRKQVLRALIGCAMAGTMALAACASNAVSNPPASSATMATTSPSKTTSAPTPPTAAQPQYGGTLTFINGDPMGFDPTHGMSILNNTRRFTQNDLLLGDWAKGPAGTGQTDWQAGFNSHIGVETGGLAESWEFTDDSTVIYHIRHGVHFFVQPGNAASVLVNGRELTADDVVWSAQREWTAPKSTLYIWWPPDRRPTSFKALDKYTVEIKYPPAWIGNVMFQTSEQSCVYPREVVDKLGSFDDWRNIVGTGPFWIEDYVSGSQVTYQRNPNYWQKDPVGPGKGNQLPYVDMVKQLIITDPSTQKAALRTGKTDVGGLYSDALTWEDRAELGANAPSLQWKRIAGASVQIWGREDKADLPFQNLLVRQAMNLAVDKAGIIKDYYKGNADLLAWPFPPYSPWSDLYVALDQMPSKPTLDGSRASVQELVTGGNADKAKELLKSAGYPNGFKTQVACTAAQADLVTVITAQLAKVGIDMTINQVEQGVYNGLGAGRSYPETIYRGSPTGAFPSMMVATRLESTDNNAYFHTKVTDDAYLEENKYVARDDAKWTTIVKGVTPFILEQAPGIWMPAPWGYRAWWPWLKNYHGEGTLGFDNAAGFTYFAWIDQSLKTSMGH